jgi:hypothetical protein
VIDSYLMSLSNDVNDFDVWSVILLPLCTQFNHLEGVLERSEVLWRA